MISEAYVFIDGLEAEPIICGLFKLNTAQRKGSFVYGKSYLAHPKAFAIDPLRLPLTDHTITNTLNKGVFGVLADAGPDAWGKKLILGLHTTKPQNDLEYLLAGSGYGVGAITFSLSKTAAKPKHNKNSMTQLSQLIRHKELILQDQQLSDEAKKAFEFGQSMGGARPKTQISDNGLVYLAKFNRPDDLFNVVRAEHATMSMARELGIETANTRVETTPHGDVLLVERFDLDNGRPADHFLSANSIIQTRKVAEADLSGTYSYGQLAEFIRHKSAEPQQTTELFKRMVFNVFIGNTDDHSRNHAMLYSLATARWCLSPAYDITPVNSSAIHGIGIGEFGRLGTVENLLSQASRFGLNAAQAKKIINETREYCRHWPKLFKTLANISTADLERLKGVIPIKL